MVGGAMVTALMVCRVLAHAARSGTEKIIGRYWSITLTTKPGSLYLRLFLSLFAISRA